MLATRGYAVLQVNFRGSGGYGYDFVHAGWREWGGKMQDDVTDATRWAIAAGHRRPEAHLHLWRQLRRLRRARRRGEGA